MSGAPYAAAISARMIAEHAADLSDAEIERTLRDCVMPTRLIALAKELRDAGLLGGVGLSVRENVDA